MPNSTQFTCGRYRFSFGGVAVRPVVMGILNVTPDSFSDGGRYQMLDSAMNHAEKMIAAGVDIIDIGGESSRPGAPGLSVQEELDRVMPVIFALRDCGVAISIDTCKPEVMREAVLAGVDMINDISGFRLAATRALLSEFLDAEIGLCVMHMQKTPVEMQIQPSYDDVNHDIIEFLRSRVTELTNMGIAAQRICIDPGLGFGKTLAHNIAILQQLPDYAAALGLPVLIGLSRKSMIGAITGKPVEQRMAGSLAGAVFALSRGAKILRVHDVAETVDAIKVWQFLSTQMRQESL
jgi:dihydropteroate synthase